MNVAKITVKPAIESVMTALIKGLKPEELAELYSFLTSDGKAEFVIYKNNRIIGIDVTKKLRRD